MSNGEYFPQEHVRANFWRSIGVVGIPLAEAPAKLPSATIAT